VQQKGRVLGWKHHLTVKRPGSPYADAGCHGFLKSFSKFMKMDLVWMLVQWQCPPLCGARCMRKMFLQRNPQGSTLSQ